MEKEECFKKLENLKSQVKRLGMSSHPFTQVSKRYDFKRPKIINIVRINIVLDQSEYECFFQIDARTPNFNICVKAYRNKRLRDELHAIEDLNFDDLYDALRYADTMTYYINKKYGRLLKK